MKNIDFGTMIILAYPETFCSMPPSWYRPLLSGIGVIHDNKICAGHAAILLASNKTGELLYTDFGRYITAKGMGRTRTVFTDPDVHYEIKARFDSSGHLSNLNEILQYTASHPEKTHGSGALYASVHHHINLNKALQLVLNYTEKGSIAYAPFSIGASNCSRYVGSIINAGLITAEDKLKFKMNSLPVPSPLSNVYYGKSHTNIFKFQDNILEEVEDINRKNTLSFFFNKKPVIVSPITNSPITTPGEHFQWLSGLGSGSWFGLTNIKKEEQLFRIQRVDQEGQLSFDQIFKSEDRRFNIFEPYQFIYDCNALLCTVMQDGYKIRLNSVRI